MNSSIENSWRNTGGLWQDVDLMRAKSSRMHYRPQPITLDECLKPLVLTLRGPRRVGKTMTLKLLVADLIEKRGVAPQKIVWTSLELLRTLQQFEDHIVSLHEKFKPQILFIDEVTSVTGWQKVIKKHRDNGRFSSTCIVLTGSSAHDLKAGAERMAGRRGGFDIYDRVLLPMSYATFFKQTKGSVGEFLKVGGFPFRAEELVAATNESRNFDDDFGMAIFDEVYFYEIIRRRLNRNIGLEVLGRLSQIKSTAISYDSFAKNISITKDTARNYLDCLGEAFLLSTISSYDTAKSRIAPKKDKKFIWVDPAIGQLPAWVHQGENLDEPCQAEFAVGIELLRRYEHRLWEGLSAPRNVFTWKSKAGNEIDFLVIDKTKKIKMPYEVKYQSSISPWDFQVIEKSFHGGTIVTRSHNEKRALGKAQSLDNFFLEK